jgi:medium-chain acyl-[acyl-carrier-protein] hydrolase
MANAPLMNANAWLPTSGKRLRGQLRLFCLPYAGGGASLFHTWSELLPAGIEVCPVQLPGRETRLAEQAFSQVDELLDPLEKVLLPYLDEPYALFGHSMGALISFELARRLRRNPSVRQPLRLLASGCRAPQLPDPHPPTYHLPEGAFIAELRRLRGTPEAVLQHPELLHLLLPLLRADFALCETYAYTTEQPLACPLSVFGGLQDSDISRAEIIAWSSQTTSTRFKARFFPGDHFYLHQEQPALLRALAQDLLSDLP